MKATLTRSGATGYSTANWKSYDVWGGERASTGSGSMFGYCGNLGHPTDPENGLIYMRARFYEPWTGRFLSEDPSRLGSNWYAYCSNVPSSASDVSGRATSALSAGLAFFYAAFITWIAVGMRGHSDRTIHGAMLINGAAAAAISLTCNALQEAKFMATMQATLASLLNISVGAVGNLVATVLVNYITGDDTTGADIVLAIICGGAGGGVANASEGWLDEVFLSLGIPAAQSLADDLTN